eukprot:10565710-Karenia_brevis.AAC.1
MATYSFLAMMLNNSTKELHSSGHVLQIRIAFRWGIGMELPRVLKIVRPIDSPAVLQSVEVGWAIAM